MRLVNLQKIRVKEYTRGYVVEIEKKKWYGKKYWTHLISVSGIEEKPWYYKKFDTAVSEAGKYFEWDLIKGYYESL